MPLHRPRTAPETPALRTDRAACRRVSARADHGGAGGAGQIARLRPRQSRRTEHHAIGPLRAGGVAGRGGAGEGTAAVAPAIAISVGAGSGAGGIRGAAHVTGGRLAGETAVAPPAAGAGSVGTGRLAAVIVAAAAGVTGGRPAGEIATVARRTFANAVVATTGGATGLKEKRGQATHHHRREKQESISMHGADVSARPGHRPPGQAAMWSRCGRRATFQG